MTNPYIVSIDFGSTSAKCLIFDAKGKKIVQIKKGWEFVRSLDNASNQACFHEQAAWKLLASCCQEALQTSGVAAKEIACVIPTSQRHGAVLLDEKGKSLFTFTNADERSAFPWGEITAQYGCEIYDETGRWPQKVFLPAHLFWLLKHYPEISKKIAKLLGIHDWLVYRLSGQMVSEATVAGDLLLMNVKSREWSHKVTELFGVKPSLLPPLIAAGTPVGHVSPQAAKDTGLLAGTPVLNGAADSQMALLGAGALTPQDVVITFGTSIPVLYLMDSPRFHQEAATWTNCHVFPQQWILESNSGDSGLCLNNFRNTLLPKISVSPNLRKFEDIPTLFELDQMVEELDGRKSKLIASWGPVIFNGKKWPKVSGVIRGLNLLENYTISPADLYLSLVENIGLAIKGNLLQLVGAAGREPNNIFIGGPAIDSIIWQRLLASILRSPLIVPEEKEVTPLGAAVLAATKLGLYEDISSAVKHMVYLSEVEPEDGLIEFYKEKYGKWLEVYQYSLS